MPSLPTSFLEEGDFFRKAVKQQQAAFLPLGRIGQPEDIAKAIAFYASDDSAYLTGSYLPVSGGGEMK
ncbi:SDR family oxidoreductase [Aneurinibacillus aneurinilyticus]|uniref:SDR family oxidoreductase n=1 Tax=Aneurinibacillus aneurinilyticus TaxID=1391 RepID=UPI003523B173